MESSRPHLAEQAGGEVTAPNANLRSAGTYREQIQERLPLRDLSTSAERPQEDVRTQDLSRRFQSDTTGFVLTFGFLAKRPDHRAGQREQHPEIALVGKVEEHGTGKVRE
jgi:hypothetical protein